MILAHSYTHAHGQPETLPDHPVSPVPSWLRDAVAADAARIEDVALAAGAALAALDAVVRRQERWAGAWRHRLALAAAARTAAQAGRTETPEALRDAVLLTRPGDDCGPAGRMLQAWQRLVSHPVSGLVAAASLEQLADDLRVSRATIDAAELARDLRQNATMRGLSIAGVTAIAGLPHLFEGWLADAVLARRLGWSHAVPLLGTATVSGRSRRGPVVTGTGEREKAMLSAQAQAALRAIDLSTELGRRAGRLIAVEPKLRAKGSALVVERLLAGDAMVASAHVPGMSDRGLRRLFDRLVELGAVRELSGRPTFRIYGL